MEFKESKKLISLFTEENSANTETIEEYVPAVDVIAKLNSVTYSTTSPIGDVINVELYNGRKYFTDFGYLIYEPGDLVLISSNFLAKFERFDGTSADLKILDAFLPTSEYDYTSIESDFVYFVSISKNENSVIHAFLYDASLNSVNVDSRIKSAE